MLRNVETLKILKVSVAFVYDDRNKVINWIIVRLTSIRWSYRTFHENNNYASMSITQRAIKLNKSAKLMVAKRLKYCIDQKFMRNIWQKYSKSIKNSWCVALIELEL